MACGTALLLVGGSGGRTGRAAEVSNLAGERIILDLGCPQTIEVEGPLGITTISVEEGGLRFVDSPCPHRLCVKRGRATQAGDLIACLPNGVVARITGDSDYDGITP